MVVPNPIVFCLLGSRSSYGLGTEYFCRLHTGGTTGFPFTMAEQKREWPELLDASAEEAKAQLEKETGCRVYLVESGAVVTMDFREDRIRIFFNQDTGKVIRTPRIG